MPNSFRLSTGNQSVHIADHSKAAQLSKDLQDAGAFSKFASDPQTVAANYGITIDQNVASKIKQAARAINATDVSSLKAGLGGNPVACTAAVVAEGAAAPASTKIAVAV